MNNITIQRYGARNWAVYVDGCLLCVTVYLKGARAVAAMLNTRTMEVGHAQAA